MIGLASKISTLIPKHPFKSYPLLSLTHRNLYYFGGSCNPIIVKTINLPFLADSINEGTVAELVKSKLETKHRARVVGRSGLNRGQHRNG